jgi:hypothetical protein
VDPGRGTLPLSTLTKKPKLLLMTETTIYGIPPAVAEKSTTAAAQTLDLRVVRGVEYATTVAHSAVIGA